MIGRGIGLLSTLMKKRFEFRVPSFVYVTQLNFCKTARGVCLYNIVVKDLYV